MLGKLEDGKTPRAESKLGFGINHEKDRIVFVRAVGGALAHIHHSGRG
jgi:hypothetical protein